MNIAVKPTPLAGTIRAIDSKSDAHRLLICAGLAAEGTAVALTDLSQDLEATVFCLKAMGCAVNTLSGGGFNVSAPSNFSNLNPVLDCGESGSTLRFLLPVAAALFDGFTVTGRGRLPERPLGPIKEAMAQNGCNFEGEGLPLRVSGRLRQGKFYLPGNVSSQFVSGLLFALPLLEGDSEIILTSPLESGGYTDMTVSALFRFGVNCEQNEKGYFVPGGQKYISPGKVTAEGDWSNAAFWLAAGALVGLITCTGLNPDSLQRDKRMAEILEQMGANVSRRGGAVNVCGGKLRGLDADVADIPDLVPVLAAVMAAAEGKSRILNAGRLRLKESDRLTAVTKMLTALGGDVREEEDSLIINGKERLTGGTTEGFGDHRIVMAAAAAACVCRDKVVINGAEAVEKSYPLFFRDYNKLGGKADVI